MLTEEYEQAGMSPEEARRAAAVRFGNLVLIKERGRDVKGAGILDEMLRNAWYALRNLRRTPAFTATVVLTLAIGIGANTALFSIIDSVLLRPLPYPNGKQLMMVYESMPRLNTDRNVVSPANWLDWQRANQSFESLAAWNVGAMTFTGGTEPERLNCQLVSSEFLPTLRVAPQLGRIFTSDDDQPGANRVVILSHRLWQRLFGGDQSALGRMMELDDAKYEIIGVMPSGFRF